MACLSEKRRAKVQAAWNFATNLRQAGEPAQAIIGRLCAEHGGTYRPGAATNMLRVAGVAASCTWSRDEGLIDAWRRLANLRLCEPVGGWGSDR